MKDTHEDTGYSHKRDKKRVPIEKYGNKAKADKAKAYIKRLTDSEELLNNKK